MASATLLASLEQPALKAEDSRRFYKAMEEISGAAFRAYRGLVYETDGFTDYFWNSTVINEIATLNIGSIGQIIIRNRRQPDGNAVPAGSAAPAATDGRGQANRPPLTGVINHVSYGVAPWDTEKVKAELERRGLNPRSDMVGENSKSFHVLDPDGWDLQISNQTKDS